MESHVHSLLRWTLLSPNEGAHLPRFQYQHGMDNDSQRAGSLRIQNRSRPRCPRFQVDVRGHLSYRGRYDLPRRFRSVRLEHFRFRCDCASGESNRLPCTAAVCPRIVLKRFLTLFSLTFPKSWIDYGKNGCNDGSHMSGWHDRTGRRR